MPEPNRDRREQRRTPNSYNDEDRKNALKQLNDESRLLMEFRAGCILLDLSVPQGYLMARKEEFPGARQIGEKWKITREVLRNFLYGN